MGRQRKGKEGFKIEKTLFVSVSRARFTERFWKTEKKLPFKERKYQLDPQLEPKGRWDLLFIVIESFKYPQVLQLYLLKDVPLRKESLERSPEENLLVFDLSKFSEERFFDLSYYDDLGALLEKALIFFQNHRDEEGRIYGLGRLSYLFEHDPEALEELAEKIKGHLSDFSLRVEPFRPVFGTCDLPLKLLSRHFIVLGETGSGKTFSVLKPVMESLARRAGDFSALIIDPKLQELKAIFLNALPKKKAEVVLDVFEEAQKGHRVDLFEGMREKHFEEKLAYLFRMSPAFQRQAQLTKEAFWNNAAQDFIKSLLRLDQAAREKFNKDLFSFFQQEFLPEFQQKLSEAQQLSEMLLFILFSLPEITPEDSYFKKLHEFTSWLAQVHSFCHESGYCQILFEFNKALSEQGLPKIIYFSESAKDTFSSIISVALPFFEDWTNPVVEKVLWSDPFNPPKNPLSIREAILKNKVLFFSFPEASLSEYHYRLGRLLKSKYFAFTYNTYDERRRNAGITPVFYVADEFHRFITGDEESGEQSFLDRCRAYGVSCLLATQSISSLKYGLNENTGNTEVTRLESALEIILNNCGTKFFFRTTDTQTNEKLKAILPGPPNPQLRELGHVIEAFPVSLLSVGECYFLTPKGTWGRTRIVVEIN